jgi:hypothetical protein
MVRHLPSLWLCFKERRICRPAAWGNTYSTIPHPQQSSQLPPRQPSPAYAQYPYQAGVSTHPGSNPYTAAYTPTYPQPQYTHAPSPHHQPSAQSTPTYGAPAAAAQAVPADFLSQLIGAGLIPAGKAPGVGIVAGPTPVAPAPRVFNLTKFKVYPFLSTACTPSHVYLCSNLPFDFTGKNVSHPWFPPIPFSEKFWRGFCSVLCAVRSVDPWWS